MTSENNVTYELTTISIGVLISGQPYQRPVRERKLTKLMQEWDPSLLDPLVVSYRDGCFYLVDGQHRVILLRRKFNGDVTVPCKLYHGMTYQQEAELCYKLDKSREHLSMAQATNALLEAGTDPEIIAIQRLLEANGFTWALDKDVAGDYEITAVRLTAQIAAELERDPQVQKYVVLQTCSYPTVLPDSGTVNLTVETGDHNVFPVSFSAGTPPTEENEIALSALNVEELNLSVGDTLRLFMDGEEVGYTVCGIYSDITNGGKTAKIRSRPDAAPVIWSVLYASLL